MGFWFCTEQIYKTEEGVPEKSEKEALLKWCSLSWVGASYSYWSKCLELVQRREVWTLLSDSGVLRRLFLLWLEWVCLGNWLAFSAKIPFFVSRRSGSKFSTSQTILKRASSKQTRLRPSCAKISLQGWAPHWLDRNFFFSFLLQEKIWVFNTTILMGDFNLKLK